MLIKQQNYPHCKLELGLQSHLMRLYMIFRSKCFSCASRMNKERSLSAMIIKFIIGIVLLWISRNYLTKHPAEKEAITSWFSIMFTNLEARFYGIWRWESSTISYKHQLQDRYDDLMQAVVYIPSCEWTEVITTMRSTRDELYSLSLDEFETDMTRHYARYLEFQQQVDSLCE